MSDFATLLMALSGGIFASLGAVHLAYTFRGRRLDPRDPALVEAMRRTPPRLTRETDMWRAWVGFNASHALGAISYGSMLSGLALWAPGTLTRSPLFLAWALVPCAGYLFLARRYWFSVPLRGIAAAAALLLLGLVLR